MSDSTIIMPAVALRGTTILPDMIVHFDMSREKSIKAVETAMLKDQKVFLVTQREIEAEYPGFDDVYKIGTIARVKQVVKLPKNIMRVLVDKSLEDAMKYALKYTISDLVSENRVIHPDTLAAYNEVMLGTV